MMLQLLQRVLARSSFFCKIVSGVGAGFALSILVGCNSEQAGLVNGFQSSNVQRPENRAQAQAFLQQATFGADENLINELNVQGYAGWINGQLQTPNSVGMAALWDQSEAALRLNNPNANAGQSEVLHAFWNKALTAQDQLRWRVAYALSQIFVVSMLDANVAQSPRAVAAYMDMLARNAFGSYRNLLEDVSRHPMMGLYLSHLRNQKEDLRTGRVPDENYAREVLQLFSIGLFQLNASGQPVLGGNGQPIETYSYQDIEGLARVFTGFSYDCPDFPDNACFFNGVSSFGNSFSDRNSRPMVQYPQFHSRLEKRFLGVVIPEQNPSNPELSVKIALDTIANYPNVAPFMSHLLIQRLVTSNPSPAYIADISSIWRATQGQLGAVVKAILLHPEARKFDSQGAKLKEPVLKLSNLLRSIGVSSDSNLYQIGLTDDPLTSLGMSPLRSPSVFNFYRPGYRAPNSVTGANGLLSPEMQLLSESSAAGYVNFMRNGIASGFGNYQQATRRSDVQLQLAPWLSLADRPADLVDALAQRLLIVPIDTTLRNSMINAINRQQSSAG